MRFLNLTPEKILSSGAEFQKVDQNVLLDPGTKKSRISGVRKSEFGEKPNVSNLNDQNPSDFPKQRRTTRFLIPPGSF